MDKLKFKAKVVEAGLTLGGVAAQLGVNPSTLTAKITGKTDFSRLELSKLKEMLNLSFDEFYSIFFCDT